AIAIVFAVVTLTFLLIHLAPGTPFVPSDDRILYHAVVDVLRRQFGLDRPLGVQYVRYVVALLHGDPGYSFSLRRPIGEVLATTVPNTLLLSGAALAIDFLLGAAIGLYQAARARHRADVVLGNATLFLYSVPTFWLGLVLVLVFGQHLAWFPVGGDRNPVLYPSLSLLGRLGDRAWHLALPALTLGVLGERAACSICCRAYPVVTAAALLASVMVVLGSLVADVLYSVADPRIRLGEGGARA